MPVTIKKSQLMYKNESTGEYVSVDAVADKTSQQQINGINTAASNAIASINTAMQDIDTQPLTTLPKKAYKKDLVTNEETLASAATHAYAVGDYFYVADNNNDISLYKATAAIAVGNTISPGTGIDNNCIPAALADDVTSLSNDLDTLNESLDDVKADLFPVSNTVSLLNYEQTGANLYNYHSIVRGKYIYPTTGNVIAATTTAWAYAASYVPVTAGDTLTANVRFIIAFYDADFTVVSSLQLDSTKQTTVPDGAVYARFSVSSSNHADCIVNVGTSVDSTADYKFKLNGLDIDASELTEPVTAIVESLTADNTITVDVNGDGDYTSLTEAVYNNLNNTYPIVVKPGTYDVEAEYIALFGEDVVDSLADSTTGINGFQYGISINRKITFETGAHVVCDFTGRTVNGLHRFSVFTAKPNAHFIGLDLDCTAVFYGIHDDYATGYTGKPFTIKYENCRIVGHNLVNANCIGGGAHKYSRHILKNCYFCNNVTSDDLTLSADVRYHNTNTADAEPELYVSDCYFSNNLNVSYYGAQTTLMRAYVNNCYAPKGINKVRESSTMNVDNVVIYAWNNQTE